MSNDFHNVAKSKAIKIHQCSMCNKVIEIGEIYCRGSGVFESEFYCFKAHQSCNELRNDIYSVGGHDGLPINFGDFEPEARAYAFNINFDSAIKIYGQKVHQDLIKNGYLEPQEVKNANC